MRRTVLLPHKQLEGPVARATRGVAEDCTTPWFVMELVEGEPFLNALSDTTLEQRLQVLWTSAMPCTIRTAWNGKRIARTRY